ncbi:MAG: hypothetical protein RIG62_05925 [Cyclobacteriaceae bacterium]
MSEIIWQRPKQEDKFRICFRCSCRPDDNSGLNGFEVDKSYTGRAYNGLFEIAPDWGRGRPSILLRKRLFDRYFEIVNLN